VEGAVVADGTVVVVVVLLISFILLDSVDAGAAADASTVEVDVDGFIVEAGAVIDVEVEWL